MLTPEEVKSKGPICNHQFDGRFYLQCDVCFVDSQAKKKSMVI